MFARQTIHHFRFGLVLLAGFALVVASCVCSTAGAEDCEFFEKKIRPVLVERCYKCHSADGDKVKGGLLLDTREGMLKGGDHGPAIIPGDAEKSRLIEAIRYQNEDLRMPPKKRLPDQQ